MTHHSLSPDTTSPHPVEKLWRELDLPEWFLGNGGSNTKLYDLYDRIRGEAEGSRCSAGSEEPIARQLLREARQYVFAFGNDEDAETQNNSINLLSEIDALLSGDPAQPSLGEEIAKLMDKHGITPAKPKFWLELESLISPMSSTPLCTHGEP